MALLENWIQECAQAEQHWLPIQVFYSVFLKGGELGSGGWVSGLIHIIIKKVQPSMCSLFLYLFACPCLLFELHSAVLQQLTVAKEKKKHKKNIYHMLFSLESLDLWSILSLDRIHTLFQTRHVAIRNGKKKTCYLSHLHPLRIFCVPLK